MVSVRDAALTFSTWVFPALAFPLLVWGFFDMGGWRFALVALGVPLVFGYLAPGVAVVALRRWRFTTGPRIGGLYVHHGFLYSAKLGFVLFLAMRAPLTIGAWEALGVAILVGATVGYGGAQHDLHAVKAGRIELLDVARGSRTPEQAVMSYMPALFALGATYALVSLWAFRVLVVDANHAALPWVFGGALAILILVPAAAFAAATRARPSAGASSIVTEVR